MPHFLTDARFTKEFPKRSTLFMSFSTCYKCSERVKQVPTLNFQSTIKTTYLVQSGWTTAYFIPPDRRYLSQPPSTRPCPPPPPTHTRKEESKSLEKAGNDMWRTFYIFLLYYVSFSKSNWRYWTGLVTQSSNSRSKKQMKLLQREQMYSRISLPFLSILF